MMDNILGQLMPLDNPMAKDCLNFIVGELIRGNGKTDSKMEEE